MAVSFNRFGDFHPRQTMVVDGGATGKWTRRGPAQLSTVPYGPARAHCLQNDHRSERYRYFFPPIKLSIYE